MGLGDRIQRNVSQRAAQGRVAPGRVALGRPAPAGTSGQRRSLLANRPPPAPLDASERRLGFAAAALATVAVAVIWVPRLGQHAVKGQASAGEALGIGLAMAVLIAWAAFLKRRWILAFAALYVGFLGPWSKDFIVGAPFVALAGWLIIRGNRARSAARAATAAEPGPGRTRGAGGRSRASSAPATEDRPRPSPSKRYTPPKPPPRPEGSGRGRQRAVRP